MPRRAPALLDRWIADVARALGHSRSTTGPASRPTRRPPSDRWARHIADPTNLETYLFLRSHTRRGFIAQFPASRFLAGADAFRPAPGQGPAARVRQRSRRAHRPWSRSSSRSSRSAILHITDFFVEGREELLLEQEASYRRAIDHAPACIFMADAADGRIFAANQVAERMLGLSARRARGSARAWSCYPPGRARARGARCCARPRSRGTRAATTST